MWTQTLDAVLVLYWLITRICSYHLVVNQHRCQINTACNLHSHLPLRSGVVLVIVIVILHDGTVIREITPSILQIMEQRPSY